MHKILAFFVDAPPQHSLYFIFLPYFSISFLVFFLELSEGLLAFKIEVDIPIGLRRGFWKAYVFGLCNGGGSGPRESNSREVRSFSLSIFRVWEMPRGGGLGWCCMLVGSLWLSAPMLGFHIMWGDKVWPNTWAPQFEIKSFVVHPLNKGIYEGV